MGSRDRATVIIAFFLLAGLSGCATFTVDESDMLPSFGIGQLPSLLPEDVSVEEHHFTRPDGTSVYGLGLVSSTDAPTLLYFGGNQQSVDNGINMLARRFPEMGLNVYYFDRRGQGRNPGTPTVDTTARDALLVYDYVDQRTDGPLILLGLSLGGFETTHVITERPADAVILAATATNVDDYADAVMPWYAKPFIELEIDDALRGIDNAENLSGYEGPTLLIAGSEDRQTPPELTEKLYEASPSEHRRLVIVEGASHNNLLYKEETSRAIQQFLTDMELLPPSDNDN